MKAGLNLFSLRRQMATEPDFLRTACRLRDMGYAYLQYSGAAFDPHMIRRVSEESGLPVVLTHVPYERIVGDTQRLMQEHDLFGCRNIGLGAMPISAIRDEAEVRQKIAALEQAAERMSAQGFCFFYHHHHMEFRRLANGQTIMDVMIEQAPHIHFTADTYWLQYGGACIPDFLERVKGRVGCVHLKDYRIADLEGAPIGMGPVFAPVGDGVLPFPDIVKKMRACGTEWFLVEQDNATDFSDPFEQVGRSIHYLTEEL